jgi:hypothetical protein
MVKAKTLLRATFARAQLTTLLALSCLLSFGCKTDDAVSKTPPYITQKGCEFTLVLGGGNSSSIISEKSQLATTYTLSMGEHKVKISNCRVIDKPESLPFFKE